MNPKAIALDLLIGARVVEIKRRALAAAAAGGSVAPAPLAAALRFAAGPASPCHAPAAKAATPYRRLVFAPLKPKPRPRPLLLLPPRSAARRRVLNALVRHRP
jgi:hypothetical protein